MPAATATSFATQVCRMHERLRSGSDLALGLWESPDAGLPFVQKNQRVGNLELVMRLRTKCSGAFRTDAALREFERIRNVMPLRCKHGRDSIETLELPARPWLLPTSHTRAPQHAK